MTELRDSASVSSLVRVLSADPWRLSVLRAVSEALPDGWVAGGFVRNAVWDDYQGSYNRPRDVDVVFVSEEDKGKKRDEAIEADLKRLAPDVNWCVRNQSRMRLRTTDPPYKDILSALAHFPETASAVAVRMRPSGEIEIAAPFGLRDLFSHVVEPTPTAKIRDPLRYTRRIATKGDDWARLWPNLRFHRLARPAGETRSDDWSTPFASFQPR